MRVVVLGLLTALCWDLFFWDATTPSFEGVPDVEGLLYDSGRGNHLLGLAVAIWFTWRRLRVWVLVRADSWEITCSVLLMACSVGLRGWAEWTGAIDLQLPALSLGLLAGGMLFGGRVGFFRMAGPAMILILAMPIPTAVINGLLYPMQLMTASGVSELLDMLRIDHVVYGEQIRTRGHVFYVVEGCAGLRTIQSVALATVVYLDFFYRSPRQVGLVSVVAMGIAVAGNLLRVLVIVLSPDSEWARDHEIQGLVMVSIGILLIAGFDVLLQYFERRFRAAFVSRNDNANSGVEVCAESAGGSSTDFAETGLKRRAGLGMVGVVLFGAIGLWGPIWAAPGQRPPRAAEFATKFGGWRADRTIEPDRRFLGSVSWSDHVNRIYRRIGEGSLTEPRTFEVLVLVDHRLDRRTDLLSPKTELARPGFRVESREPIQLADRGRRATYLDLHSVDGRELVIHWRLGVGPTWTERLRSVLALDQSGFHRPIPALAVRLSMVVSRHGRDGLEARRELREIAGWIDQALVDAQLSEPSESR